ncbi:hypothetical protein ACMFMF_008741 [Clarireedia jacksonii]
MARTIDSQPKAGETPSITVISYDSRKRSWPFTLQESEKNPYSGYNTSISSQTRDTVCTFKQILPFCKVTTKAQAFHPKSTRPSELKPSHYHHCYTVQQEKHVIHKLSETAETHS